MVLTDNCRVPKCPRHRARKPPHCRVLQGYGATANAVFRIEGTPQPDVGEAGIRCRALAGSVDSCVPRESIAVLGLGRRLPRLHRDGAESLVKTGVNMRSL